METEAKSVNKYLNLLSLPNVSTSDKKVVPKSRQTVELTFTNSPSTQDLCDPSGVDMDIKTEDVGDDSISSYMESLTINAVRPPRTKQHVDMKLLLPSEGSTVHDTNSSDYYFVISAKWLRSWESYVSDNSNKGLEEPSEIDNWSLIDDANKQDRSYSYYKCSFSLRRGVQEGRDFVCLPLEAWEALRSWYGGGPPLPRRYTASSPSATVSEAAIPQLDLWPSRPPSVFEVLGCVDSTGLRTEPVVTTATAAAAVNGSASIRRNVSTVFNDCGSGSTDEVVQLSQQTVANATACEAPAALPSKVCFVCKKSSTMRCSKCSAVNYCAKSCQKAHWKYHKKWCGAASEHRSLPAPEFEGRVSVGRRGRVGLHNLGNSCYMNSSLQCLSHIAPLTAYFISDRYAKDINASSGFGTGGRLACEYSSLLGELWFDSKAATHPYAFKRLMGQLNPEYAGMAQQDAHELVEHLLDKLHEDVNRVTQKPYTEKPEGDGSNDAAVAAEEWAKHSLREDSYVKEVVGSQLRSQLVCPDCGKVSVSFEYHQTVQLAIPRSTLRPIKVIYVPELGNGNSSSSGSSNSKRNSISSNGSSSSGSGRSSSGAEHSPLKGAVGASAAAAKAKASRPLLTVLMVDRLDVMGSVKREVASVLDGIARARTTGPKQGQSGIAPGSHADSLCLLELSMDGHLVTRVVDDSDSVSYLREDSCLVAYRLSEKLDGNLVLLQRKITVSPDVARNGGFTLTASLTSLPIVLSFGMAWSCARVRVLVWQHIVRYLKKDSSTELGQALKAAESTVDVKAQMKFAKLLPLRLVDKNGRPLTSRLAATKDLTGNSSSSSSGSSSGLFGLSSHGDLGQDGDSFGSQVPFDANISLAQFVGMRPNASDIPFLSVDWSGDWLALLDERELDALSLHQTAIAAGVPDKIHSLSGFIERANASREPNRCSTTSSSAGTSSLTLEQCLAEYTREEQLDEANAWYCSRCKKHQPAKKVVKFWADRLPEVLILTLKRFEFRDVSSLVGRQGIAHREKIDAFVDFPLNGLDLGPYCAETETETDAETEADGDGSCTSSASSNDGGTTLEDCEDSEINTGTGTGRGRDRRTKYDLFAVCNHFGRLGFGHYTAFARDWRGDLLSPHWHSFDDDEVAPLAQDAEVKTRAAYILFYRRRPS